jgi:hypothetical protein
MGRYLRITFDGQGEGWTWRLQDASGLTLWTRHSTFGTEEEARNDARRAMAVLFRLLADPEESGEEDGEIAGVRPAPPRYHETPSIALRSVHR